MSDDWFERVRSSIPRGFSRIYILQLLKEKPMTGGEIIRTAKEQSGGKWVPSPGLVYPLLGRLLSHGMITETTDGRYTITAKGERELENLEQVKKGMSDQYDTFMSLGAAGKFLLQDAVDRVSAFTTMVLEDVDRLGEKQRVRYKTFLRNELRRLQEAEETERKTRKQTETAAEDKAATS
ncbi:MAG: PadR family transcriptional regulator [Thaumarchaeota archaeon]|nr:PadR family transcriptional regulator [Nitrososphaerota archaeon]MCL5317609.1 PadR family transcriptional regulator [Nitrososphaerota archaeon]